MHTCTGSVLHALKESRTATPHDETVRTAVGRLFHAAANNSPNLRGCEAGVCARS